MSILREAEMAKTNRTDEKNDEDFDDSQETDPNEKIPHEKSKQAVAPKFDPKYFYMPTKEQSDKYGQNEAQRKVPIPIEMTEFEKLYKPFNTSLRSDIEWQSVGRVAFTLEKLKSPARWYKLNSDHKTVKYKNSQMWWDKHLMYRKQLVMFQEFGQDKEDYEDVLDDIQADKDARVERKKIREEREAEGQKYIEML